MIFCRALAYAAPVNEVHKSSPWPNCQSGEELSGRYLYAISLHSSNGDRKKSLKDPEG